MQEILWERFCNVIFIKHDQQVLTVSAESVCSVTWTTLNRKERNAYLWTINAGHIFDVLQTTTSDYELNPQAAE